MERLTKKELRALLEFIKECYPICDRQTFAQRVVSRLSKIVLAENISHNAVKPRMGAYLPSQKKKIEQRVHNHPVIIRHAKTRDNPQGQFHRLGLHNKFYPRSGVKYRTTPRLINQVALNHKGKPRTTHLRPWLWSASLQESSERSFLHSRASRSVVRGKYFAERNQLLVKLLSPHVISRTATDGHPHSAETNSG
jgi:hypothetical protein